MSKTIIKQIVLPIEMNDRLMRQADYLGVSFSSYAKMLLVAGEEQLKIPEKEPVKKRGRPPKT